MAVLHGQVPDRLEEPLYPQGEGHQNGPVQVAAFDHDTTDQDYAEAHSDAHQGLDQGLKTAGVTAGFQVGVQVLGVQVVEVLHVGFLAVEAFNDTDAGDVLVVLAVHHGDGPADAHEGVAGELLPVAQYEEEHRQDAHADQG